MKPLRKLTGPRLQRGHINQLVTALIELEKQVSALSGGRFGSAESRLSVQAVNETGLDLRLGDAAMVSGNATSVVMDLIQAGPLLTLREFTDGGSAGSPDTSGWAVAEEAIPAGVAGRVTVSGIALARVTGSGAFVTAAASGVVLVRGSSGARILQDCGPTVSGLEDWALLLLEYQGASGGGGTPGDTVPVIVSEGGTVGTGTDYARDDTVPGLKLQYNDLSAPENISAIEFKVGDEGARVAIVGETGDDMRAAVARDGASVEVVPGAGLQVRLDEYGSPVTLLSVTEHGLLATAPKLDDCQAPEDNTDLNATTSAHGLLIKATAPASGIRNVVAIDNTETAYKVTALFDNTNPAANGTAAPGTSLIAARRDHVHAASAGSLTNQTSELDTTMEGIGTDSNAGSMSLASGTWLVMFKATITGDPGYWKLGIHDGSDYLETGWGYLDTLGNSDSRMIFKIVSGGINVYGKLSALSTQDIDAPAYGTRLSAIKLA